MNFSIFWDLGFYKREAIIKPKYTTIKSYYLKKKTIGYKLIFKVKYKLDKIIERYKVKLVT